MTVTARRILTVYPGELRPGDRILHHGEHRGTAAVANVERTADGYTVTMDDGGTFHVPATRLAGVSRATTTDPGATP